MINFVAMTSIVVSVSSLVHAQTAPKPSPVEQHLMASGVKITQTFQSSGGLRAIVADTGKERRLFYVTPDGKTLVAGSLYDVNGTNITNDDINRAGIPSAPTPKVANAAQLQQIWQKAKNLRWISEGKSQKIVYIFMDANCRFCKQFWTDLRPAIASGQVQVRWLPVALLDESSKSLAAAIYASKAPSEAMTQLVNNQLRPVATVGSEDRKALAYNLLTLRDTGYQSVPVILYQQGGQIKALEGAPDARTLAGILQ